MTAYLPRTANNTRAITAKTSHPFTPRNAGIRPVDGNPIPWSCLCWASGGNILAMRKRIAFMAVALLSAAFLLPPNLLGQAVATFPLINPNYTPNKSGRPIIPLIPQTGSKQPIDPNDYIGVDISKMSSSERAKIESAFRKHTGEGFTGSKYDPKSPTFAYGPEPTSQPSNQDKITAEKLREIKSVVDNYKAKTISQETALKFLEALGVSSDEARKVLQ